MVYTATIKINYLIINKNILCSWFLNQFVTRYYYCKWLKCRTTLKFIDTWYAWRAKILNFLFFFTYLEISKT